MGCPYCQGAATQELDRRTTLGYRLFRCRVCRRTCNERTSTPFNHLQVPTDIALLVVLWRLRYKLSLRDLAEMFLERGFVFTYETVRDWEARFAPWWPSACASSGGAKSAARGMPMRPISRFTAAGATSIAASIATAT